MLIWVGGGRHLLAPMMRHSCGVDFCAWQALRIGWRQPDAIAKGCSTRDEGSALRIELIQWTFARGRRCGVRRARERPAF